MTEPRRDGGGTPFGAWLRSHPDLEARNNDLSATDSDMWIHKFLIRNEVGNKRRGVDHLMLVEVKCFQKEVSYAQNDTLGVIDLILRAASSISNGRRRPVKIPDRRSGRPGVTRYVRWLGVHVLQLASDRPDKSEQILWDGRQITETNLIELLRFDRDADHPERELDTRRHHLRPVSEIHPQLALVSTLP